jgi:hypothetical protein
MKSGGIAVHLHLNIPLINLWDHHQLSYSRHPLTSQSKFRQNLLSDSDRVSSQFASQTPAESLPDSHPRPWLSLHSNRIHSPPNPSKLHHSSNSSHIPLNIQCVAQWNAEIAIKLHSNFIANEEKNSSLNTYGGEEFSRILNSRTSQNTLF